ncbi:MAG: hypothetical protein WC878_05800 [Candidatus Paceibacterota bacterium]
MQIHVIAVIKHFTAEKTTTEIINKAFEIGDGWSDHSGEIVQSWIMEHKKEGEELELIALSHAVIPRDENCHIPRPGMR